MKLKQCDKEDDHYASTNQPCAPAGEPDEWMQRLRGHGASLQEGRRHKRAPLRCSGLEGRAIFSDAERAALTLAEAVTRLSDRPDPVPDEI
jgi:hypothetical protein